MALDDAVFGQVAELHVTEGLPWADHCDVSAKTLHAGDVITKAEQSEGREGSAMTMEMRIRPKE